MTFIRNTSVQILLFALALFLLHACTRGNSQTNSFESIESNLGLSNEDSQSTSTIVVFGRTSVGKNALCNQIAGSKVFIEGETLTLETSNSISPIVQ